MNEKTSTSIMSNILKPLIKLLLVLSVILSLQPTLSSQSLFNGMFEIDSRSYAGYDYKLYRFNRTDAIVRAKYFATDAYNQYLAWKGNRRILLVTAGAFSDKWTSDGIPVGLCVDNGTTINKTPKSEMDGMVIIYNGGSQIGGVAVVDLDESKVKAGLGESAAYFDPRDGAYEERIAFLQWGETNGLTLFQTQLVYSSDKATNFNNLDFGDPAARRFLALCFKNGTLYHIVVDAPDALPLNRSAKYAKNVLDINGFSVKYILNLDTGDKNILHVNNGYRLVNLQPNSHSRAQIEKATNLLIYYTESGE